MTIYSLHDYFTGIFVYKSLNNDLPLMEQLMNVVIQGSVRDENNVLQL